MSPIQININIAESSTCDLVRGEVTLSARSNIQASEIKVSLCAVSETKEVKRAMINKPPLINVIVDTTKVLASKTNLQSGVYTYPFTFHMPSDHCLPPSFVSEFGSVIYYLKANVTASGLLGRSITKQALKKFEYTACSWNPKPEYKSLPSMSSGNFHIELRYNEISMTSLNDLRLFLSADDTNMATVTHMAVNLEEKVSYNGTVTCTSKKLYEFSGEVDVMLSRVTKNSSRHEADLRPYLMAHGRALQDVDFFKLRSFTTKNITRQFRLVFECQVANSSKMIVNSDIMSVMSLEDQFKWQGYETLPVYTAECGLGEIRLISV